MSKKTRGESKYKEGISMTQFGHIMQVSSYNHNYYVGFDGDLLLGISDDDMTTEWYLINGRNGSTYLGYTIASNDEPLQLGELT